MWSVSQKGEATLSVEVLRVNLNTGELEQMQEALLFRRLPSEGPQLEDLPHLMFTMTTWEFRMSEKFYCQGILNIKN